MSKVRITQEQADIVEQFKSDFFAFDDEYLIGMIKGRYEIETEFKEGDIVNDNHCKVKEVSKVEENGIWLYKNYKKTSREWLGKYSKHYKQLRHATDIEIEMYKERRFWHENNREVGDFRKNDVIYNKHLSEVDEVAFNLMLPNYKDEYEIICFAHDRKDIKHD